MGVLLERAMGMDPVICRIRKEGPESLIQLAAFDNLFCTVLGLVWKIVLSVAASSAIGFAQKLSANRAASPPGLELGTIPEQAAVPGGSLPGTCASTTAGRRTAVQAFVAGGVAHHDVPAVGA